ncbi:MAG: zf-TFIIB domain-containing protein [Planctomycetes bacterium]|nr:zf-TFIIB domain-containing protein [Planctomycetota bacterium]
MHKPGAAAPPPPQPQAQPQRAAPRVQQAATRPQQAAPRAQEPQQVKQVKPAKPPKPAKQVLQAQPRRPGPQARPSGSILDAPVVSSMSQVLRARAARQAGQPSAPGAARSPVPVPAPSARDERGLLESQELDLYKTGRTAKVRACPECRLELLKVLCLGTEARVCPECKGLWLPYEAVRAFAGEVEWFRQLGAAVQAASRPQSG